MFSLACTTKRSLYRWESDGQLTHTTGFFTSGFRQQLLPIEFLHACTLLDIFFQFSCWTRSVPKILIIHNHFMFLFYNNFFLYFSYSDNNLCVLLLLLTDWEFISSYDFLWKVSIITLVSCLPLYIIKFLRKKCSPPSYLKLT